MDNRGSYLNKLLLALACLEDLVEEQLCIKFPVLELPHEDTNDLQFIHCYKRSSWRMG
jgi:hypothetical protein